MNTINQRVKELRLKLGLSQDDFGNAIGLSKSGISNIENGARSVRETHIKLICSAFDVDETWLRTGESVITQAQDVEAFENYLSKLGYRMDTEYDEVLESHVEDMADESGKIIGKSKVVDDATFLITVKRNRLTATFTETEFDELQDKFLEFRKKVEELEADYQAIIEMRIQKKAEAQRKR